jgi:hypothetical protein
MFSEEEVKRRQHRAKRQTASKSRADRIV